MSSLYGTTIGREGTEYLQTLAPKKFDWISVVMTGLVFLALAAWAEFVFFEFRYDGGSYENKHELLDDTTNVEHVKEVVFSNEGTGGMGEEIFIAGMPEAILGAQKKLWETKTAKVVKTPKEMWSSSADDYRKRRQKLNRLYYAIGITITAAVVISLYNVFNSRKFHRHK